MSISQVERNTIANDQDVHPRRRLEWPWVERPQGSVARIVGAHERDERDLIARDAGQSARGPPQQADGAAHNRVEYRLDIRLRLTDDSQDVAGGSLFIECRGQLAIACL